MSVSEISSIASITKESTNSDISSMNETLLASEMSIFDTIAYATIQVFTELIERLKSPIPVDKQQDDPQSKKIKLSVFDFDSQTPIQIEFELLKNRVMDLNKVIRDYNQFAKAPDVSQIIQYITNIDSLIAERSNLITSFSRFIIIAKDSNILRHSILKGKNKTIDDVVKDVLNDFPGVDTALMTRELQNAELQKTLAKFIRAMGLLDNMKHRLQLKKMIAERTEQQQQPSRITQLLSVAIGIDTALKQYVDEPVLSVDANNELTSDEAIEALKYIHEQAQYTVAQLTDDNSKASSSALSPGSEVAASSSELSPGTGVASPGSEVAASSSELSPGTGVALPDIQFSQLPIEAVNNNNMETTFNELKSLLTELKTRIAGLHAEATAEATAIIDEIETENKAIKFSSTSGGKSHRQIRRTKWSTPRRHRNSRVKSLKPKRHVNKRKTKSAHKKRATKKH